MSRAYILSPKAQQDITEIRAFYLKEADVRVARYVLAEINRAFRLLATTPGAGHSRGDLTNEPVKFWAVFSYMIVYDAAIRPIGIARVLHGGRELAALLGTKR